MRPFITDDVLVDKIDASIQYGVLLYSIIHPAWRVMAQGAAHASKDQAGFNQVSHPSRVVFPCTVSILYLCELQICAPQSYHECCRVSWLQTELSAAILAYDAAWAAYRAFGLAEFYAPSLYHP
jgi:hypothetical protein